MQPYANLSGHAGVVAYELGTDSITVKFSSDEPCHYLYNVESAGLPTVLEMQRLAMEGKGLTTFISQHVRERYAQRW